VLSKKIEILERALLRERKAKEIAEGIIENRLRELYDSNQILAQDIIQKEEFQKDLIENLVDAFFIVDFKGNILQINKEANRLIGANQYDSPKSINEFSKKNQENIIALFKDGKYSDNELILFDFINRKRKKKYITIKSKILYNTQNKPYAYQAIVRDVTSETLREQKLQKIQKALAFETLLVEDLIAHTDLTSISKNLVKHVAEYLGTEDCVFYAVINDDLIQISATDQKLDNEKNIKNSLKIKIGNGIVGSVAKSKIGIIVGDTSKNENYIIDDMVRLSEITVPILLDGELVGIIDAEHPKKYFFKKSQLKLLTHIANVITVYLKNSIHEVEKSKKRQELSEIQSRLEIVFSSFSDAKVIESGDRHIEYVSQAFLKLFGIPQEAVNHLIGMDCNLAAENSKTLFVTEKSFIKRIDEILLKREVCLDEILELKDGRYLTRDYTPIFNNSEIIGHVWSYKDVTLNMNYDKSLEFQNKKYKSIIENMNLGLMEVDNNETILNVNNAFSKMCGYSPEELIGFKARDIILENNKQEYMQQKIKSRQEGLNDLYEMETQTKTGETKYWLISSGPNTNINGEIIGSIGIHLDITELKMLNIKADSLNNDLTLRNEELSHYAHIVSHDLKTPLRTISTCLNWLLEDNTDTLDKESKGYIDTVEEAIKDMDKLITSTLNYSYIRTANIEEGSFVLQDTVESIISNVNKKGKKEFNIIIAKPLPNIKINEVKARQIFQNLIENSYKYRDTEKNSFVNIDWEEQDNSFLFSIKDNGIGINEKHSSIVFDAFKKLNYRSDSSGLGLFIVEKLITSYGGKIWVESKLGVGTTFYFTILK
jgi:two-component system, sporulation sensor kinase E